MMMPNHRLRQGYGSFHGNNDSSHGGGELLRVGSGVDFDYSRGSFQRQHSATSFLDPMTDKSGGLLKTPSFIGTPQSSSQYNNFQHPHYEYPAATMGGGVSHQMGFGNSCSNGSFTNGLPGMGPDSASNRSLADSRGFFNNGINSSGDAETLLTRHDSRDLLQRQHSVAGQFFQHNQGGVTLSALQSTFLPSAGLVVSAKTGAVTNSAAVAAQIQQQRRLSGNPGGADVVATVEENVPTALDRSATQSRPSLERKSSAKRVGMYFKNVGAESEGVQYKKDGDPGTNRTASSRDRSLVSNVKPILLLEMSSKSAHDFKIDGRTICGTRPGANEGHTYGMADLVSVSAATDVEINSTALEAARDSFVCGCNVGMIMADADCPASDPPNWYSWTALRTVMKGVFGIIRDRAGCEMTVSFCLLRDDQCMDLIADGSATFKPLVIAESPLFGNVANGLVYYVVESAADFNDKLDAALNRAAEQGCEADREYGIVLCTCVLKTVWVSPSNGTKDVIVSSIFASGVGDGIIHYNRILDKNPAEPRAMFYSVLHRSTHTTAIFYSRDDNADLFSTLNALERLGKVETRKPKVGSVSTFISYANSAIPKVKRDLQEMKDGRQRMHVMRLLERLELMHADATAMMEDPENCVPCTYI